MSRLSALAERLHSLVSRRSPGNRPVTKRQTCHAPCIDAADHVAQRRQRMIVLVHRLLPFVASASKWGQRPSTMRNDPSCNRALTAVMPERTELSANRILKPASRSSAISFAPDGSAYHITFLGSFSAW